MSKAIDDLKNEHEAILVGLRILDSVGSQVKGGKPVAAQDVAAFLGFLVEFADKCHHGKEEGILFTALGKTRASEQAALVEALLAEHVQGRKLITEMSGALAQGLDRGNFTRPAAAYASLLRSHIQTENDVLFPMAERVLSLATLEQVYRAFEEHEEKVIGQGRHEQLHALLDELTRRYVAG